MSDPASGFVLALASLAEAGVEFLAVGVGGINFYARPPPAAAATPEIGTRSGHDAHRTGSVASGRGVADRMERELGRAELA